MAKVREVRASHILVQNIKKATEILEKIQNGESFSTMAKKFSKCPSKAKGGDLGFFGRGSMVREFEEAAFNTPKGQVTGPVKTQFGYHLIKVTDTK